MINSHVALTEPGSCHMPGEPLHPPPAPGASVAWSPVTSLGHGAPMTCFGWRGFLPPAPASVAAASVDRGSPGVRKQGSL